MMIAKAVSRLVLAVSRSIRDEIGPITRSKKTAPRPAIPMSFLFILILPWPAQGRACVALCRSTG